MRLSKPKLLQRGAILALVSLFIVGALAPIARSYAQDSRITVTLAVPVFARETLDPLVKEFEAANANIHLQLVTQDTLGTVSAANSVDTHLDTVQKFTSSADVLIFNNSSVLSPEATRSGYFLNLQPLIDSDKQLDQADFVPALFRAFQWDQGTWALPLAADATVLTYDPSAFDKVGLAYPTDNWTLDDLINAVKVLNVKDANGKVTTPGIELYVGNNDIPLYMSLLGKPLVDVNAVPNPPFIDQPEVITLLDKLKELQDLLPLQNPEFNTAPIRIESILNLAFVRPNEVARKGVLLPGGHAYLDVSGVAVSGGTQYPEQAYAVARFLTTRPEVNQFTSLPARQSLKNQSGGTGNGAGFGPRMTPELQGLLDKAVANSYTSTDRRFFDYLSAATVTAKTQNLDSRSAAAQAQSNALKAQQTALDRKANTAKVAVVATPVPTADPNKGITLKFGVTVFATSLPKKAEIEALAAEFVKANPGIAKIDIQNGFSQAEQAADKYDCFYLPYSAVPSIQLDKVLNLDPFLSADKNYNAADYVGGALTQVQRDGKIWALPMGISPTVMWFDPTSFANAGLQKPAFGWNISNFKDTLNALKPTVKEGKSPFFMSGPGGAGVSLLMLIASYGGLPIDWSSTPPVVKLTDKTNADAMRQVLDLAKAKLIDYKALGSTFGFGASTAEDNPLYSEQLNGLNFQRFSLFGGGKAEDKSKFEAVTFPRGTQLQALSYSSASLYISAKAQNPDACYKWISAFAARPDLMSLMPVRNTQLADPSLETTSGKALAAVYRDIAKVLADPNTLKVPSLFDGGSNISGFVVQFWLFQAWDNYVLNDKDLDTELKDAQIYVDAYLQCAAAIPAYDPAQLKYQDYIRNFTDCAVKADPRLKSLLGRGQ